MLVDKLLHSLTLEEKSSLCSGNDFWHTKPIKRIQLPSIMMADGPNGLRKQSEPDDKTGLTLSLPATCFPTTSTLSCSWNIDLLFEVAASIGEECLKEQVSVLLGPGINIKRSPLCGRNFEYFSEDPFLTGTLAVAFIKGLQSKGVGAAVKHFAGNNQETKRMTIDSIIDERTLREIYLYAFEMVVKEAKPWMVMSSYNKVNGCYTSENKYLLKDILINEWGFNGVVVSDWGATNDRVLALNNGLDLEMPSSYGYNDKKIIRAIKNQGLSIENLDNSVKKILTLITNSLSNLTYQYNYSQVKHHKLAYESLCESAVLLKNEDNILPISTSDKFAIIGELARTPRFQGSGSSSVSPFILENPLDEFSKNGVDFTFASGYSLTDNDINESLINKACEVAKNCNTIILYAGLTEEYESEGFDRESLSIPNNQIALIERLSKINPNIILVLSGGAPIEMPWINSIKGLLNIFLGGESSASATVDLLLGWKIPSGKLTETYPLSLSHTPSFNNFPGGPKTVEYREGIYVGYRYYDSSNTDVLFPFGFGLSYTSFEYKDMKILTVDNDKVTVSLTIKNIGEYKGSEIIQVYIHQIASNIFKAEKELKAFTKINLLPSEEKTIIFNLNKSSFSYYNVNIKNWDVEPGYYEILIGSSSRDIRCKKNILIKSTSISSMVYNKIPIYYTPTSYGLNISKKEFEMLYGKDLPNNIINPKEKYTLNSTLGEIKETIIGKKVYDIALEIAYSMFPNAHESQILFKMITSVTEDFPIRNLVSLSNGKFSLRLATALIKLMNEDYLKSIATMIQNNIR